jgi:hypothetical protein
MIFKLVGIDNNRECILKKNYNGIININIIKELLLPLDININDINKIKFIKNNSIINNNNSIINNDEYIFIYTTCIFMKNKLIKFFDEQNIILSNNIFEELDCNKDILMNNDDTTSVIIEELNTNEDILMNNNDIKTVIIEELNTNNDNIDSVIITELMPNVDLNTNIENINVIIDDSNNQIKNTNIINNIYEENLEYFRDPDFKLLLKIYKNKSYLFSKLLQYVFIDNLELNNINDNDENNNYIKELNLIKELELNIKDEDIIKILQKYKGHLNLTLRELLKL